MQNEQIKNKPLEIPLIVTEKNGLPAIELRKLTTDIDLIKIVVSCAFHNRPIVINPIFTNQHKSISTLVDKGILYFDSLHNEYRYTQE